MTSATTSPATLASRLAFLMDHNEITGGQLAAMLGERGVTITRSYISLLRSGKQRNPNITILECIADLFGCSLDFLVGRDNPRIEWLARLARDLSDEQLNLLCKMAETARRAEGLGAVDVHFDPITTASKESLQQARPAGEVTGEMVNSATAPLHDLNLEEIAAEAREAAFVLALVRADRHRGHGQAVVSGHAEQLLRQARQLLPSSEPDTKPDTEPRR